MKTAVACSVVLAAISASGLVHAEEKIAVGSKRFAESTILGELAVKAAVGAGAKVEHKEGLGGTAIVFRALEQGDVDVYPDYTGTLVEAILHEKGSMPLATLREKLAPRGLCLGDPLGFENSYALAVKSEAASTSSILKLSDLTAHTDLRLGLSNEFKGRDDGWIGLSRHYAFGSFTPKEMDHGLAYQALATGSIDVIEVYSTDAKIEREHLRVLEDDKHFFPSYEAVFVHRCDLETRAPRALGAIRALSGKLDAKSMIALNARVEIDGLSSKAAAETFGRSADEAPSVKPSWFAGLLEIILKEGPRHLFLVTASLLLSILFGVPLGIAAQRNRTAGAAILSIVGVLQTIPALALLCFLIPPLGIGTAPTIVALFLYGLLPIVRNTFAGLEEISPGLRESALVLGLTPSRRLFGIELPLASRTMLAGVKTSAVINVGTATVAAFVGAGGFGQPISTGLNLNDSGLILQGAVPAALLALVVQGLFAILERVVVPRGLSVRQNPSA